MGTGAALAIAAGALVLVFYVTGKQEAATMAQIAKARQQQQQASQGDGALSFADVFRVGATAFATYVGGPGAGAKVLGAVA